MKYTSKILEKTKEIISSIENSETPMIYFFLTFLFVVSIRNFFDQITDTTASLPTKFSIGLHQLSLMNLLSNTFWYLGLAILLMIVTYIFTRQKMDKIAKLVLTSFLVLLSVSFFDTILSLGVGFDQMYMLPSVHDNILLRWITFSIPFGSTGVTPGMKIETAIIMTVFFLYVYTIKKSKLRGIIGSFTIYTTIFFWGCMPFAIKYFLIFFELPYELTSQLILNFTLLLMLFLGFITYYLYNKKYPLQLIKDMDPLRIIHYLLMFVLGIVFGNYVSYASFTLTETNIFHWFFAPAAIIFAGLFALVVNALADVNIDKVSNPNRSLIDGTIPRDHFIKVGIISFFLACLYASVIDQIAFLIILLVMGSYFIYSAPPLRLKRIFFFSKFWISFNSLILIILGYYFVTGRTDIPYEIVLAFFIGFTALINFIDIKDYEGDKREGIKTIPTVLGLKRGKLVIGAIFLLCYIAFGVVLQNNLLLLFMTLSGILQFYLINQKDYKESYVFSLYLIALGVVILSTILGLVTIPGLV